MKCSRIHNLLLYIGLKTDKHRYISASCFVCQSRWVFHLAVNFLFLLCFLLFQQSSCASPELALCHMEEWRQTARETAYLRLALQTKRMHIQIHFEIKETVRQQTISTMMVKFSFQAGSEESAYSWIHIEFELCGSGMVSHRTLICAVAEFPFRLYRLFLFVYCPFITQTCCALLDVA